MKRSLPQGLYRAEQVRELDRLAIEGHGISGFDLMRRAAQSCLDSLLEHYGGESSLCVLCGSGNNAGDGYLLAALARQAGLQVSVVSVGDPARLRGDAQRSWQLASEQGVPMQPWQRDLELPEEGLLVDALLGTGLKGEVQGDYRAAIEAINASASPVLAVDIPSGLSADSGAELGCAVRADLTVTFIALKRGLFTAAGPLCCGELLYDDLDVPSQLFRQLPADLQAIDPAPLLANLPRRRPDAHKGRHGHLLVVGGNHGMGGAAILAAEAALYAGSGLVSVATRAEHIAAMLARRPELMARGVEDADQLQSLLVGKSALVVGPGLGQDDWAVNLLECALASGLPLLLDADALNLLADQPQLLNGLESECVLTPHPGEAARLLACSSHEVQRDRFAAVARLQKQWGDVVVLKGAGSLVAGPQGTAQLCRAGNPAMAVGGMGDLLSGVIGSLLAQGVATLEAALLGCWLHSAAADRVALEQGVRGLLATDLLVQIRKYVNGVG
ncbi:NAD(P)H-hydrate dehydratase [Aestuariirhabdus litorea]|uniref:Bifunctional NAD(P)H-hydrate repair enzyme n=1 Tax=Aestuariirhabdus litorea TaxID=2528527 RepID=A0A3P3VKM7_9GAMM|nr:NAD(P)H-hydrate dehydratase [Aestuariirhabdus litorea]RRJ82319.1 NAD(P)H-hydrate dehydratase [Aestuariirhabdus litorea]RWW92484.1 NAD(P)H-hydrate dehydratase [Endozoicomonadaceae bacterium GTF-13]